MYGEVFRRKAICSTLPSDKSIVEKSGAWFSFQGERLGRAAKRSQFLKDNQIIAAALSLLSAKSWVFDSYRSSATSAAAAADNGQKRNNETRLKARDYIGDHGSHFGNHVVPNVVAGFSPRSFRATLTRCFKQLSDKLSLPALEDEILGYWKKTISSKRASRLAKTAGLTPSTRVPPRQR